MGNTALRDRNKRAAMSEVQRVAVRLMRKHGFANVTVEEIAAAAGVSASTIYRYFGTKEALVLWGDRPVRLVETFVNSKVGKNQTVHEAFVAAAADIYSRDETGLLAQLNLVFASEDLTIAFEHEILSRRHEVALGIASHEDRKPHKSKGRSGLQDLVAASANLAMLLAVLDRWQSTDGKKPLAKMLAKTSRTFQPK